MTIQNHDIITFFILRKRAMLIKYLKSDICITKIKIINLNFGRQKL